MPKYRRGDKVEWGPPNWTKAIFVEYDPDAPKRYAILAVRIGTKQRGIVHMFRWELRGIRQLNGRP